MTYDRMTFEQRAEVVAKAVVKFLDDHYLVDVASQGDLIEMLKPVILDAL